MSDFFDQRARQQAENATEMVAARAVGESAGGLFDSENSVRAPVSEPARQTPGAIKAAVQELLRAGVVEAEARPKVYDTLRQFHADIARVLEPLDLQLRLDEVRGLAWLCVGQGFAGDESPAAVPEPDAPEPTNVSDGWSHPLVRRQRLTLEQSLLLALLRQHYLTHEQQAGIGGGVARVALAELGAELATHLGDSGSDQKDDKRLRQLLATLKEHGVVGEVDGNDQVLIRPLIAHVANPASLLAMLRQFQALGAEGAATAQDQA